MPWSAPLDLKVLESKRNGNQSTQQSGATNSSKLGAEQTIVILGGGRRSGAIECPQYQDQSIKARAIERVRYGVSLSKAAHLSRLLTGGAPDATSSNELTEVELTQMILKNEFQVNALWVERQSRTTDENAAFSAKMLKQEGITISTQSPIFGTCPEPKPHLKSMILRSRQPPWAFIKEISFTHWISIPVPPG